jgi:hypothetical protein
VPNFSSRSKYLQNVALSLKGHRYVFNEKDSYDDKKGRKARHHHRIKRDINRIKRDVIIASKARHQSHQKRDINRIKSETCHRRKGARSTHSRLSALSADPAGELDVLWCFFVRTRQNKKQSTKQ